MSDEMAWVNKWIPDWLFFYVLLPIDIIGVGLAFGLVFSGCHICCC